MSATPINAAKTTELNSRKREALRLIAVGRAALDRGDTATAISLARQAQALNVPESQFTANEPRVWQFVLDAESAARRGGVALTGGTSPIQTAGGQTANESQEIAQMLFNGNNQAGVVQQVQAEQIAPSPLMQQQGNSAGEQLYYAGMQALQTGDNETARKRFVEAWRYEEQMPLAIRRQLKEKLTLLQPSRLPPAAGPSGELTAMQKAELEARETVSRLYREITTELANTAKLSKDAPLDALDQLNRLRRRVDSAKVDETAKRSLMAQVDRALNEQKKYIDANRAKIELDLENEAVRTSIANDNALEASIDEEIASLADSFNELMKERRYDEALVIAKKVQELKPDSTIASQMFLSSRMGSRHLMNDEISAAKEDNFATTMIDVERTASQGVHPDRPYAHPEPKKWLDISNLRLRDREDSRLSSAEQAIQRKLSTEITATYNERPLNEVLTDLSAMAGVPIVLDNRALGAVRVMPDTPVSLNIPNGIALKSALNIILGQLELTHTIENDVLSITSIEAKRSKVYPETYRVADLVTPIPNFTSSYEDGLAGALRAAYQMTNPQTDIQIMPVSPTDLARGTASNDMRMNPNMLGQYAGMGAQNSFGPGSPPMNGRGGGAFADFDSLIQLIQTTVVPDTWEALGGPSTMAPYPQNLSLVISTTSDVHDQISDLLESLRRLQNLQITIEVRFITLSDTFFEQIGIDFDVKFDDNVGEGNVRADDSGPSMTIGFDGINGLPTPDLDITLENNSFGVASPFGAPDAGSISSIGFAILSDIQAFFFLQAAQGDSRNNVMQAPKVTLFDGQFASIQDFTQRPFVTSITPVVGDFAVAQQPVIVVLNEGTQLNVQGIVSNDKRFVRLTLVPFFSQIGDVDTFTYEGRRSTSRRSRNEEDTNGDGVVDNDDAVDEEDETAFIEGTTVQLPTFAFTTVQTTVSVPDGGTILLGGIKRLAEGRSERGIPMLSKIPYVSRLFRNVGIGRDARSLMMMVTPRIIIQEEEEIAQTGFNSQNQ